MTRQEGAERSPARSPDGTPSGLVQIYKHRRALVQEARWLTRNKRPSQQEDFFKIQQHGNKIRQAEAGQRPRALGGDMRVGVAAWAGTLGGLGGVGDSNRLDRFSRHSPPSGKKRRTTSCSRCTPVPPSRPLQTPGWKPSPPRTPGPSEESSDTSQKADMRRALNEGMSH